MGGRNGDDGSWDPVFSIVKSSALYFRHGRETEVKYTCVYIPLGIKPRRGTEEREEPLT